MVYTTGWLPRCGGSLFRARTRIHICLHYTLCFNTHFMVCLDYLVGGYFPLKRKPLKIPKLYYAVVCLC